jgi:Secretion system C-terminal sorting domain
MKKILTIASFYFLAQSLIAQTLTVRESYDFNIGDTIVTERTYLKLATKIFVFDTTTFIKKWFSEKKDTLYYQRKIDTKKVDYLTNEFKSIYDTLRLTLLDSPAYVMNLQYIYSPTFSITKDKIFSQIDSFNGRKILSRKSEPISPDGGFLAHYDYAAGLGRVYLFETPASLFKMPFLKERILYYRKGNETWKLVTKSQDLVLTKLKIYPNPISNFLYIDSDDNIEKVEVINLNGQIVLRENNKSQIDVSNISNGIYFIHVYEGKILRGVEKIIINH